MWVRFLQAGPFTMYTRTRNTFNAKDNVVLNNKITGDVFTGDIKNEDEIEGRQYWVFYAHNRPGTRLLLAKDSYIITKTNK